MAGPTQSYKIHLKERQFEYLQDMVDKYDLDDESKAIRCLVNYALESSERETEIFEEIRCLDC